MSKNMKAILCLVMALAVTLTVLLFRDYADRSALIRGKQAELTESRSTWERIAAEKEALQAELKAVKEELREAQLSLEESRARATELQADIDALNAELAVLRGETGTP